MFDWQDLRYFLVAARLGSLTAAAKELGVDHATVGRHIARLEASTKLKLIDRLPRSMRLTEKGMALVAASAPVEEKADAVIRHLKGQTGGLSGTVTLSTLPALAAFVIAPHLPRFMERHPLIRIVLSATSDVASLERGEADISLGFVRPDLPGRIVRQVGNVSFALYSSLAISAVPADTWRFIGFEDSLEDIPQQRWLAQFAAGRPFVLRSNDVATQMQAAKAGLGVALLPDFLKVEETGMVRLDGGAQSLKRPLWMSVHADIRRSPAVREVMDYLVDGDSVCP